MNNNQNRITAAQEIVLAVDDLVSRQGLREFSEWDLTVATWSRNQMKFGMRGYEEQYPDHKRVMIEIMGKTKDNPIRKQFVKKVRPNYYTQTALGKSEADRLRIIFENSPGSQRSPEKIFDAVQPYLKSRSFRNWQKDPEEPRSWLGASSFFQLEKYEPNELNGKIRAAQTATIHALEWLDDTGKQSLARGPEGGSRQVPRKEIEKLGEFIELLQNRFEQQMNAIRMKNE